MPRFWPTTFSVWGIGLSRVSYTVASEWDFRCHRAQILTHLHFPKGTWCWRPRTICPRSHRGWSNFCVPEAMRTSYLVAQEVSRRVGCLAGGRPNLSPPLCWSRLPWQRRIVPASDWWRHRTSVQWESSSASRTAYPGRHHPRNREESVECDGEGGSGRDCGELHRLLSASAAAGE